MYKIPNHIELFCDPLPDGTSEYLVIINDTKYKEFVVNKAIYDFLSLFINNNSLEHVIQKYAALTNSSGEDVDELNEKLNHFFNQLVNKRWLVEHTEQQAEVKRETKFKKNDVIDAYKVLKVVANNEHTDIYAVKQIGTRKKYILKYLNDSKFRNGDQLQKYKTYLKNEFLHVKAFNSRYINKGVDFISTDHSTYLVLQFINGVSLSKYVKSHGLTTDQKMALVYKIVKGFSIIHNHNIYHGDIHLSNILITPQRQIKIIDFGYSNPALKDDRDIIGQKLRNGGVHAFIPPERALKSVIRKFSVVELYQSEVYQIGLLMYYIFVKDIPFKAETWKTMVDEKKNFDINSYQPFLKRRMPYKVKQIITKTLAKNPEDRFKDTNSLLQAWKSIM